MPRSKRARVVHLSKVQKKGKELRNKTFEKIQEACSKYPHAYVFAVSNMRNTFLKDVRAQLSDSRIFYGKTKVMALALGRSPETAVQPGTDDLSGFVVGDVGLLFSPRDPGALAEHFSSFRPLDFARSGTRATRRFVIPAGQIYAYYPEAITYDGVGDSGTGGIEANALGTLGDLAPFSVGMEPALRKLGVPSRIVRGKVELDADHVVCEEGEVLGSAQTSLLKMFGVRTSEFKVVLRACWDKETGQVRRLNEDEQGDGGGGGGGDGDDGEEWGGMDVDGDAED